MIKEHHVVKKHFSVDKQYRKDNILPSTLRPLIITYHLEFQNHTIIYEPNIWYMNLYGMCH